VSSLIKVSVSLFWSFTTGGLNLRFGVEQVAVLGAVRLSDSMVENTNMCGPMTLLSSTSMGGIFYSVKLLKLCRAG